MKYSIAVSNDKEGEKKRFEVDFSVKHFFPLTKKDEEKIYKIVRIIDSLGQEEVEETSEKDYRFQTDNDEGKNILDGVVEDCTKM